ncbi:redoxin domain-containing protein [Niabella hibiscisoli]|nr:redoxin domain-containing protein [Niabella hibiscisoli]
MELIAIYNEYNQKGFEILEVAADTNRDEWLQAIKEDKIPWENVSDLRGVRNKAVLIYGVKQYPSNFLINREGIIVATDLWGDELRKKLKDLLK